MKKDIFCIGVSCIGSGVGQSVINSLNLSQLPVKTIGLGNNPFAYGAYDCDEYDYIPTIYADNYIDELIKVCKKHSIDLIIPGLDDEVMVMAKHSQKIKDSGIKVIHASEALVSLCRDKERTSNELNQITDVFMKSYNKETLLNDIEMDQVKFPLISKPRAGCASRGIQIIDNFEDLKTVPQNHIIQEIAFPAKSDHNYDYFMELISRNQNPQVSEISIQVVTGPEGEMLGRMASYNKLKHGVPIEIIPIDIPDVWAVVDKLFPTLLKLGLRGPINIQGRLTDDGLKLFEMNPRFTGITGLRALMGFNEVEACVKEWLGIDKGKNQLSLNSDRFGVCQTAAKSIPVERNEKICDLYKKLNKGLMKRKKTVLITGACGYLGQNLINALIEDNSMDIWAFDLDKKKIRKLFNGKVQGMFDKNDLSNGRVRLGLVDILLHLGFARPYKGNQEIADSLDFTSQLFSRAAAHQIPAIINISSQSVYGLNTPPLWREDTPVAPSIPYAQAKYSTELLLKTLHQNNKQLRFTSIRLARLSGGANGLVEVDFLSKIIRQAIDGHAITIFGGQQQMERLDIRDAVQAIILLLKSDPRKWKPVYNLGPGEVFNLIKITEKVVEIAALHNGGQSAQILVEPEDIQMRFGMDSSLFYKDLQWKSVHSMEDTIESLILYFKQTQQRVKI